MNDARVESNAGRRLLLGALAGIVALVTPLAGVEEAGAATTVAAQVVRVVETGDWDPPSGDPSGVVRVGERLVVVDSEVDERDDACYEGDVNLWEVSLADPTNVENTARLPTDEPSGVSYDPVNRLLFVSDDENVGEGNKIWVVDYDDPSNVRGEIELGELEGAVDVEDPAYDPDTRELFSVGLVRRPGGDIEAVIFRITSTSETFSGGYTIHTSSIDHLHPTDDFEGLAIDPNTKNLLVGTQQGRQIYEVDRHDIGAEPLRVIDASRTGLQYVSGLAAVDVGGTTHYWVTDRRSDCSALDGLLMELSAGPVSNRPPTLAAIPDKTVVSGQTLSFTAVASDPDPGQSLTFSLVGAPAGATIGPTSGVFSWVASGSPRELEFKVRVTDSGSPQLSAERTVRVTVVAPNQPPVLLPIPDQTVVLGEELSFTAVASDPDPGQSLTFSLVGAPAGAAIGPTSGVFSWVASGSPRELEFKVRVTDNGSPQLSAERTVRVTVVAPNQPPVLLPIPDQTVVSGEELSFTAVASDPDPGQSLTFSLVGAPAGAAIGPTSGVFSWVASGSPRELEFKVRVTDSGSPQLSAERTVHVTVEPQPEEPPEAPDDPGEPPGEPGGPDTPPGEGDGSSPPGGGDGGGGSNPPGEGGGGSEPPARPGEPDGGGGSNQPPANPPDPGTKPTEPSGSVGFSDDNGHVFEADIEWLAAEGITRGCNPPINDRFCPDDHVTRGQMAAFLVRALGYTDNGGGNEFVDDNGTVFEGDIDRLATAGVTRGCNPPRNDRFCPNDYVTRGQMAAFLVRALDLTGSDAGDRFGDDDGHVFESDIELLAAAGVTRGCNPPKNDRFCPDDYVTRGQMAAFLHRALGE